MAVISIRKFLALNTEAEQALMHVVHLLVDGIDKHAASGDSEECARFRESVRQFSTALADGASHADLLVQAGAVVKAFEEFNHFAAKQQRLQTAELQHMVKMLTSTVRAITASSSAHLCALGDIEQRIVTTSELDDVRLIKSRLSECLTEIRREVEVQQKQAAETIERLNQGLNDARKRAVESHRGEPQDEITGLPLRAAAEAALSQAGQADTQAYAAVMVLDRLQILNNRFGREVGDDVLDAFARMVRKHLKEGDRLFRWAGPALLALLPREDTIDSVRKQVGHIMATKLEHTVQTPSRSLLVPVSARWTVFPALAATRLICQKIDTFAATPALHE